MTIDEFKNLPSIKEDFPKVSGAIDSLLVDHLIATCASAKGGENAAFEAGAQKAIANIITVMRNAADKSRKPPKKLALTQLRRFSDQKETGETEQSK